jgi:CRISPR-associated endonuclease Cas2
MGVMVMLTWVFVYDVRCDYRRQKIAKAIRKEGLPVQKSVLLVQATVSEVRTLADSLGRIMDRTTDRIIAIPLRSDWQNAQICFPEAASPIAIPFIID